ncbi:hypothetical protein BH09VER1_BH09VER1_45030 [soil metagenome]
MSLLPYPIQSVNIAGRVFDANYQFPLHAQTWHQFYLVLEGAIQIWLEGRVISLKAGEALWMAPLLRRQPSAASPAGRYMIVSFVSPWPDLGANGGQKISIDRSALAEARNCADLAGAAAEIQTAAFHALCYRLLGAEAFANLSRTAKAELKGNAGHWIVAELERVMQANLGNPLGIEDMASMVHASRATLGRLFRKHRGVSPAAQFRRFRLEHGRHLLQTTSRSITEIAMETGFSSSQHFATVFRLHFGQPPSAIR